MLRETRTAAAVDPLLTVMAHGHTADSCAGCRRAASRRTFPLRFQLMGLASAAAGHREEAVVDEAQVEVLTRHRGIAPALINRLKQDKRHGRCLMLASYTTTLRRGDCNSGSTERLLRVRQIRR